MKRSLPANAKISKEAKETVQECVSEFISFITGEASDKCQREKRKTINGDDLLWAMTTLGFDSYVAPLKTYLGRYREAEGEKNSMAKQQERQQMAGGEHDGGGSPSEDGSGIVNPAVADGGYYSTAAASGIRGAHGLYERMTGGGQDDRRAALPGHFHGVQW
ncbi:hypothetical protein HPP92_004317 [Vanilla planifolia]|uniref:Transcription factor CBF/NF-Y/archaeal histone domain-containing protein n=1 Tax=Vanilla planifolia TaxID=51239 RepID=A0A835RWJ0_VANPL|nr:hypothetical protein HPP92_004317 [Vanilla planifolia]